VAKRNPTRTGAKGGRATASRKPAGRRAGAVKKGSKRAPAKRRPVTTRGAKQAASRKAVSKTARRKTAARAAASKSTRRSPGARRSVPAAGSGVAAAAKKVRGAVAAAVQLVAGSMPWSVDENDPIALLESDHRRFEDLLKQGTDTTARAVKGRTALLDTLTAALNVHELIEEQVLYPALKPHLETRAIVLEGFEEHHVADVIVNELHDLAKDNEQWGAKFKVLQESLEHHIAEEERHMFPNARRVLSRDELQDLGARMRAMKAAAERG
jgi:hemerythrin-like domain-containing protein